MKKSNNESGMTLIEVLATLTITAIIGSVVYAVFFQTLNSKEKTQSHNELRQEANVVMTQLRTMHDNSESLWYDIDMMYKDQEVPLTTEQYHFLEVQITNLADDSILVHIDHNNPMAKNEKTLSVTLPLEVYFKMEDDQGNEYELKTVFPDKPDLALQIEDPITENKDPSYVFINKEQFVNFMVQQKQDCIGYPEISFQDYQYINNKYVYSGDSQPKDSYKDRWMYGKRPVIYEGNACFKGIKNNNKSLTIENNLYNDSNYIANHNSSLIVNENAVIQGNLKTFHNSNLSIGYNLYNIDGTVLDKNSKVVVGGSARMDKGLTLSSNSNFIVNYYMFLTGDLIQGKNSDLIVGKNLEINGNVRMDKGSKLVIGGNAIFNGNFNSSKYKWKKANSNGVGTICVQGTATFKNGQPTGYIIDRNATSCGNNPGTIYVLK